MKFDYRSLKAFCLTSSLPVGVSFTGHAKLLDIVFPGLCFGIGSIAFIAIPIVWFYSLSHDATALVFWGLGYVGATVITIWAYWALYLEDRLQLSDEVLVHRWHPRLNTIAILHGLGLSIAVVITAIHPSFEFGILLYVTLAAIVAANVATPLLGIFWRFFNASWNVSTLLIYWVFPEHWQFILPLALIFTFSIYNNALTSHRFFVNQVVLEEQAAMLAAQFKVAKEEAEQALVSKNLFLSTASHDLRQPVFAIGMLTEAIASQNSDPKITPLLGSLRSSVHSLNLMFNALLDLSRIEAGQDLTQQVPVNLGALVQEVAAMFEEQARASGLQLRFRLPKTPAAVFADPDLLRQVLVNLAHNALRYTKQGGVLIGVRKRNTHWQLEVWDTGIGVADSDHEKIYSPYYRNEHAWRADASGHGLGLHVVARCAKLMRAKYGLTSRLGRGSRFWLLLDKADPAAVPATGSTAVAGVTSYQPLGGKCLIVEDDPQVVDAWAALLHAWQIEARFAVNSQEAFIAIKSGFEPGVIFCDQRLRSGESGFDILRDLLARLPNARGAMVSGEYASPELAQAEDEGYLVIQKPLNIEQLYTVLARWLLKQTEASSSL